MHNVYPTWKYLMLLFFLIVGVIYALPNLYGEDIAVQISLKDSTTISQEVVPKVQNVLREQKIPFLSVVKDEGQVLARFPDTDSQLRANDVITATLGKDYIVAPNLAPRTPEWLQALGAAPLKLGLDLRGGVHFLLAVDVNEVVKALQTGEQHSISNILREENIRYSGIRVKKGHGILVSFRNQNSLDKAQAALARRMPEYLLTQQTDNGKYVLQAMMTDAAMTKASNDAIEQTMRIINNRINELGVSEAAVQRQGVNKVSVDLPGVQDTTRAKEIIGKTASLRFQMVDEEHDVQSAVAGIVPVGTKLYYDENGRPILLKNKVILRGSAITYATATIGETGSPEVQVRLGGSGNSLFHKTTRESVGKRMAVIFVEMETDKKMVDGKLVMVRKPVEKIISVARIDSPLGNNFRIMNLDDMQYAQNLALLLRSGAFTAPVDFIQERIVGPSLGKANIAMGIQSIQIGALIVVLFMIMYYRVFGLFADFALILNIVFILAVLSLLGATLTLPGIAGIVLTVGMAVDANVLINERIREELRNGMSVQAAIRAGYERAFSTIVDANVTTLIVAIVLYTLGSGSVKGFAVTVIIGLFTSMVTAIMYTRALVNLTYGRRQATNISIGRVVQSNG